MVQRLIHLVASSTLDALRRPWADQELEPLPPDQHPTARSTSSLALKTCTSTCTRKTIFLSTMNPTPKSLRILAILGLIAVLGGCNKPRVDDIAPGLEGEWKWVKTRVWDEWSGGGADSTTVDAEYEYRIRFNKRRRIEFYRDGECQGSDKIFELRETGPGGTFLELDEGFTTLYSLEIDEGDDVIIFYKDGWMVVSDWPYGAEGDYSYNHYFRKQ